MEKNMDQLGSEPVVLDLDFIEALIEKHRDSLSGDDLDFLFTVHEANGNFDTLALQLDKEHDDISQRYRAILIRTGELKERRLRMSGQPWRTGLTATALKAMLEEHDFTEEEVRILEARVSSPNQTVAAIALGMSGSTYVDAYRAIRDKYNF